MIHILHRWGPWRDIIVEMEAGPLGRRLGLPDTWTEPGQSRRCSKCLKTVIRTLT